MVRVYKRKSNRATSYSRDLLLTVVADIQRGVITTTQASKLHNIPITTIRDRIKKRRGLKSLSLGRRTALSSEDEIRLANCIRTMEKWGFGLSRREVIEAVKIFVETNNIKTPFKNNIPGEDWFLKFKSRHNLSIKKPQGLEYARKKMTDPFTVYGYFDILKSTLQELNLFDAPSRIWNLDETSMALDPLKTKVVGQRGKACSRITSGPGRENMTVLFAASASGQKAPPLVIFKAKNLWNEWIPKTEIFPDMTYAASENGWMNSEIFFNYFKKSFLKTIGNDRPVLLIYDGHTTHLRTDLIELAIRENVTILKLPPHTSHLLQPLDLAVFKPMKDAWDQKLITWQRHNIGKKIPKVQFSTLVAETWKNLKVENIISGFRRGGIIPFNNRVITDDKFDVSALQRWKNRQEPGKENRAQADEDNAQTEPNHSSSSNPLAQVTPLFPEPVPSTSSTYDPPSTDLSFENLLVETIRQTQSHPSKPKKRIASGAEVITSSHKLIKDKDALPGTSSKPSETEHFSKSKKLTKGKSIKKRQDEKKTTQRVVRKKYSSTSSDESDVDESQICNDDELDDLEDGNGEEKCFICDEYGKNEVWYRCVACGIWAHKFCTGKDSPDNYICDYCE
jgi:hypothetical protein